MKRLAMALFFLMTLFTTQAFAEYFVVSADQVTTTNGYLFVNIEGEMRAVDALNMANDGKIVAFPTPNADVCPNCRHRGYVPGKFCRWCNFPDDASVRRDVTYY
ncbi:MAG: hypothetical protein S4CHLAM81_07250 [Chlamydiales bacterium]|nr:hypothetical protein [Chlamydiales bacterium]MCH9635509.1 hypothetical protein [Chlamydiales bacterium]MCH9703363.1 hypothetical protein [Chlamydiota bacterium]